jgi:AraC-like DNA-binding protein
MSSPAVSIDLSEPPQVEAQGQATHGIGRVVDVFRLPELWSLHVYSYSAELTVDGRPHPISPGTVSLVPPDAAIRYRYEGPSTHLYAHLRAPANTRGDRSWPLHQVMDPGADLPLVTDLMQSAVDSAPTRPERTRADVWLVLLRLAQRQRPRESNRPSTTDAHVTRALAHIERHLSEPLTVPEVAAAAGISQHHLTRLFKARQGSTVVAYLRRRRIDQARRLLEQSTMSISAVAAAVGLPDLQAFNKACRAVTGHGPRALRGAVRTAGN